MNSHNGAQVSILFQNTLSQDISHAILFEKEEAFQKLMSGNFKASRNGTDVFLQITSEFELLDIRQITKIPLFIKF